MPEPFLLDLTGAGDIQLRVSDTVAFEGCKRKWWWEKLYDTERFNRALFIGTGVHEGLAEFYRSGFDVDAALRAVNTWAKRKYQEFPQEYLQTWDEADVETHLELIRGLIAHYAVFDAENPIRGNLVYYNDAPIVEFRMRHKILGPGGVPLTDKDGNYVYLTGKCDLALERNGGLYIVDHKTFGDRTLASNPEEALDVDDQVTAYAYLWWREFGSIPRGVIYNILVKEVPTPPQVLIKGGLSQNKQQATTGPMYRQAIKEHGLAIGPYLNFLDYLEKNPDRFFKRWTATRNTHELKAFEQRIWVKARDILRLIDDPDTYAYSSGSSYRCGGCPFIEPCKSTDDGGDPSAVLSGFKQRELWVIDE